MKKIFALCLIVYLFYLFIFNNQLIEDLSQINQMFFQRYLISLLPFIFFTNLFLKTNILIDIHKFCTKNKLLFFFNFTIILLTILIGIPSNINLLAYLEKSGMITQKQKSNLINCLGGISFPFMFLVILKNNPIKYLIIFIILGVEIFLYFYSNNKSELKEVKYTPYRVNLIESIIKSLTTILTSLIIFSSFNFLFAKFDTPFSLFIRGLIEFSYNSILLANIEAKSANLFLLIILSFTSLSLIFQIKLLDSNFNISEYIKKRAIIALLSSLFFLLI